MDDELIVKLYWDRSEHAISETSQKYGAYCHSIAYGILQSREDAEESVNDTYMDAWNAMPPHRPSILATFLGKITRRISIDRWRSLNRIKRGGGEVTLVLEELEQCIAGGQSPEREIEKKELVQAINRFLDKLPILERRVFLARYWYMESIQQMESMITGKVPVEDMPVKDLYLGLAAELLCSYGIIGDTPMERYDVGMVEDLFSAAMVDGRIIYLPFDVTIPAGESVAVEATMVKDASIDYIGEDKGKDGYDMATTLGSNLTFTQQTASISRYDQIEIVAQNFGFDLANGITEVTLDLTQPHYWMEIRKVKAE